LDGDESVHGVSPGCIVHIARFEDDRHGDRPFLS
jgi:hypothetical protein